MWFEQPLHNCYCFIHGFSLLNVLIIKSLNVFFPQRLLSCTNFTDGSFSQNQSCIKWSIGWWKQLGANMLTWRLWDPQLSSCCSHNLLTPHRQDRHTFTQTPQPPFPDATTPTFPGVPGRGRDGRAFSGQLPVDSRKQFDMGIRQCWAQPNIQGRQLVPLSRLPRVIPKSTLLFSLQDVGINDQKLFLQKKTTELEKKSMDNTKRKSINKNGSGSEQRILKQHGN